MASSVVWKLFKKTQTTPPRKVLYDKCYKRIRKAFPDYPAQVVIRVLNDVYATYRTIQANKHKIRKPPEKTHLSIRLDKRLYRFEGRTLHLTAVGDKRTPCKIVIYPRVESLFNQCGPCDPLIFERNGKVWASLSFKIPVPAEPAEQTAVGVDLGIRRTAALSTGEVIKINEFNARRRQIRFLKRRLRSKGTKSATKHLGRVRHKERNVSKNTTHHVSNAILKTKASVIVLENLAKIKTTKRGPKFNNKRSQVPFFQLRSILTYKAAHLGKRVVLVNPFETSKRDFRGLVSGERRGCRYFAHDGVVLDADLNAANNIVLKAKLPDSCRRLTCSALDGQGVVNRPIVCQSRPSG